MTDSHDQVRAVAWVDGSLQLLDQRRLPRFEETIVLQDSPIIYKKVRVNLKCLIVMETLR